MPTKVRIALILGIALSFIGCSRNPNKKSTLTINAPNQVSSMAALPGDQVACFGVTVTGPGITGSSASTCQPNFGVVAGFVAQGQSIEAMVPSGSNRKVDLYLYLKDVGDSTPCPKMLPSFSQADLAHVYLVGSVSNLTLQNATETVNITMDFPGLGQTIALGMPTVCSGNPPNDGYKILTSSTLATGTGYKLLGHAGHTLNNVVLTGTGYKLHIK